MAFDIIAARGYGTASAGDATNPAQINSYAKVTARTTNSITIDRTNASIGAVDFVAGAEILLHISGVKSGGSASALGKYKFVKITAVDGDQLSLSDPGLYVDPSNYSYQAITIPHYKNLTVSTSISPPAFQNDIGGILVLKANRFTLTGSINLVDKGLTDADARPLLDQESNGTLDIDTYSGFENENAADNFTLQKGDGACFIIAKEIIFGDNARIGDPDHKGTARLRNAEDSYNRNATLTNVGGSSIILVAPSIASFKPDIISKCRSKTLEAGKGLARCYIATESTLPFDEGLYSYDIINTPERLTKSTLIDDFGSGALGQVRSATVQQNNYARVSAISSDGKTFTLTNVTSEGLVNFTRDALVMIHASFKANPGVYTHDGRFFLAKVVGVKNTSAGVLNSITLNHSINELGLSSFDTDHYNFQAIVIPQYSSFTGNNSKTKKWDGSGGIFAIAVNGTCDLRGCKIYVRGAGGNKISLDHVSNAKMKDRLPIGAGHGSIFILAKKLIMDTSTRLGSAATGNNFGGVAYSLQTSGGYMGKRSGQAIDSYSGYGGSGARGGQQSHGHSGGFAGNAPNSISSSTAGSGLQGASIFIVAEEIEGLCIDALSTGGQGGNMTSKGQATTYTRVGGAGGCGYGGAGADFIIGTSKNYGACGGVHGGGAGSSNQDDSNWSGGGGASGFCVVYHNS